MDDVSVEPVQSDKPQTRASIADELHALGLRGADTVLVHASLRSLGWVCGGQVAVVQALLDVVGSTGTLVVPTQTTGNSDPKHWSLPPVPESEGSRRSRAGRRSARGVGRTTRLPAPNNEGLVEPS